MIMILFSVFSHLISVTIYLNTHGYKYYEKWAQFNKYARFYLCPAQEII